MIRRSGWKPPRYRTEPSLRVALAPSVAVALIACAVTAALTPLVRTTATSRGWLGREARGRHLHREPVPRLGGVAVFAGVLLALLVLPTLPSGIALDGPHLRFFRGILLGSLLLLGVGMLDDLREVRPRWKVAVQVLAAVVVYFHGFRIEVLSFGAVTEMGLGWASLPATILWVVTISNAYNLIDGLDGLATGVALIALAAVLVAAGILGEHPEVVVVCAAVLGALIGFLPHNSYPARIFLGDSGSLFIGFLLAVLSVHGSAKGPTAILAVIPLFALALPLLDTALAIGRRWLRGVPISAGDANHIHHRLLALGLSRRRAVQILYLAATGFALVGLFLALAPDRAGALAVGAGALSAVVLLRALHHLDYAEFAVAGKVLATGPERARRVIRDRIYAQEVAEVLRVATRVDQVQGILADNADTFGFLHMELCRESEHTRQKRNGAAPGGQWKLDFPVTGCEEDPFVLRVWCAVGDGFTPQGAERVAQVLAPVLAQMPERMYALNAAPRAQVANGDFLPMRAAAARGRASTLSGARPALSASEGGGNGGSL